MSSPQKDEPHENEYAEYAARLKDQGNEAFKAGDIPLSITYYTQAIDMDPDNHVYYSNRSAGKVIIHCKSFYFSNMSTTTGAQPVS